jgi:hypothetical protein
VGWGWGGGGAQVCAVALLPGPGGWAGGAGGGSPESVAPDSAAVPSLHAALHAEADAEIDAETAVLCLLCCCSYPDAVRHYSEALKRGPPAVNPEAHKLYSNRCAVQAPQQQGA